MTDASEEILLKDPRLAGWVQSTSLVVEPKTTVEILAIETMRGEGLFDPIDYLVVTVATTLAGQRRTLPFPLFFRRSDASALDTLGGVESALSKKLQTDSLWEWWQAAKARNGGQVTGYQEPMALDAAFMAVAHIQNFLEELRSRDHLLAARAESLMGHAYSAGHGIAVWELKAAHESHAKLGVNVKRGTAAGGHMTTAGKRRTRAVNKQHALAIASTALSGPPPEGHRVWKLTPLAEEVSAGWKRAGAKPSVKTIRNLLLECKSEGAECLASVS